ncbi:proprotein convertase P-domain-containing protein, partial [Aequorivita lipolytica]
MKKITLFLFVLFVVCMTWQTNAQTYTQSTPVAISTGAGATYTSTLNVPANGNITDLNVDLDIAHTWVSDLVVSLTSPNGTTMIILDSAASCSQNNIDVVLDDAAAINVSTVCAPSTSTTNPPTSWAMQGTFAPNNPLAGFNGENAIGDWILTIVDGAAGDGGTLNNWSLIVTLAPPPGDIAECATGLPLAIDPPASITSTINVTETGVIGAANGDYRFDDVMLNVASGWASDLDFTLIAPSGTTLDLSSGNGGQNGLNPAQNLMFTDSSGNNVTTWGSAPPLADYQPEGGLLNTVFAGEAVNGIWTLTIVDNAPFGDGGSLNSFCLNMSVITVVGDPPVIACPTNITVNNSAGLCSAVVNFTGVAFDTEDGNISGDIIATPASGSSFAVGDTDVELSVTDSDGNTSTCNFTVTVVDNELPVAVCQNITVDLDPVTGNATVTPAEINNGSTDNCGIATYALDVSSFDCSMTGD